MDSLATLQSDRVNTLSVRTQDLHGRQTKNAGDATDPGDYVTFRQFNNGPNNNPLSGITQIGDGLAVAFGKLVASVTSGIGFDSNGNIIVIQGSGISLNGGKVSVNPGVGLKVDGSGFLVVDPGIGLGFTSNQLVIPGGAITNALLATLSVASANIQNGAVGTVKIAAAAITTALIANAAITTALIGTAQVATANIQNAAITTALIANLAVGSAQIANATIVAGNIAAATILGANIANATITTANIVSLNASQINAGTITSVNMVSGTLTLNLNGVTTTIANSSGSGGFIGVTVADNTSSGAVLIIGLPSNGAQILIKDISGVNATQITAHGFSMNDNAGTSYFQCAASGGSGGTVNILTGSTLGVGGHSVLTTNQVVRGVSQFVAGHKNITTASAPVSATANQNTGGPAGEYIACNISGSSVDFYSSSAISAGFFYYEIWL